MPVIEFLIVQRDWIVAIILTRLSFILPKNIQNTDFVYICIYFILMVYRLSQTYAFLNRITIFFMVFNFYTNLYENLKNFGHFEAL